MKKLILILLSMSIGLTACKTQSTATQGCQSWRFEYIAQIDSQQPASQWHYLDIGGEGKHQKLECRDLVYPNVDSLFEALGNSGAKTQELDATEVQPYSLVHLSDKPETEYFAPVPARTLKQINHRELLSRCAEQFDGWLITTERELLSVIELCPTKNTVRSGLIPLDRHRFTPRVKTLQSGYRAISFWKLSPVQSARDYWFKATPPAVFQVSRVESLLDCQFLWCVKETLYVQIDAASPKASADRHEIAKQIMCSKIGELGLVETRKIPSEMVIEID